MMFHVEAAEHSMFCPVLPTVLFEPDSSDSIIRLTVKEDTRGKIHAPACPSMPGSWPQRARLAKTQRPWSREG